MNSNRSTCEPPDVCWTPQKSSRSSYSFSVEEQFEILTHQDEKQLGAVELSSVLKTLTDCSPLCEQQVVNLLQASLQFVILKGEEGQPSLCLCCCHQLDHSWTCTQRKSSSLPDLFFSDKSVAGWRWKGLPLSCGSPLKAPQPHLPVAMSGSLFPCPLNPQYAFKDTIKSCKNDNYRWKPCALAIKKHSADNTH